MTTGPIVIDPMEAVGSLLEESWQPMKNADAASSENAHGSLLLNTVMPFRVERATHCELSCAVRRHCRHERMQRTSNNRMPRRGQGDFARRRNKKGVAAMPRRLGRVFDRGRS